MARATNELPAGVMCKRDGRVFNGAVQVGRVERMASASVWLAYRPDGSQVARSTDPSFFKFATRRCAVVELLRLAGVAG